MLIYPIKDWRFFERLLRRCNCQLVCSNISGSFFLSGTFQGVDGVDYMGEIVKGYFRCFVQKYLSVFVAFDVRCMYIYIYIIHRFRNLSFISSLLMKYFDPGSSNLIKAI